MSLEKRKAGKRESEKRETGKQKGSDYSFASFACFCIVWRVSDFPLFAFRHLPFAFLPMVVRIASNSTDSASKGLILAGVPISESLQISNQYAVSDASFSASPILWMKSSLDSALLASR
jgi:hypothetical protein